MMNEISAINHVKGLIIDGVGKANSGHPGGAMSSIDFAYLLYSEFLNFDPKDPKWLGRDRFILSAGHESMLIYSLLHLNGWLEMDEIKNFRQFGSKTPGHPENILTPGVECTTGPLGQGAAMSVGFAFSAAHLSAVFNEDLFGYNTYALLGDGCIQEDVTLGAASIAGHLGLSQLVWYYDRNKVQISGTIDRVSSDSESDIFKGFGWDVIEIDGHNHDEIRKALKTSKTKRDKPLLIIGNTTMAKGSANLEGSPSAHGAPFSAKETEETKAKLGIDPVKTFDVPESVYENFRKNFDEKSKQVEKWNQTKESLSADKEFSNKFDQFFSDLNPDRLTKIKWDPSKPQATRNSFGKIISQWTDELPNLVGGSADLEPSNMTGAFAKKVGDFSKTNRAGRSLAFGVREFAMSAMTNGIALHGGLVPFDATFLSFADYSRPALRLGAIQEIRVIHEFTHDSFYLGEDGPTHQPIEHVMSLRAMPNFYVMRPADSLETEIMMREALKLEAPSAICLSRQKLPFLNLDAKLQADARKGGYVLKDGGTDSDTIIFATGSEVSLAIEVANELENSGSSKVTIVSLPCWELFNAQDQDYKDSVIRSKISKRISIEAGVTMGWKEFTGDNGLRIGIDHYGASAPASALAEQYGFTSSAICGKVAEHF